MKFFGTDTPKSLVEAWKTLATTLNALGGANKTVEAWKKVYTEYKCHVRQKLGQRKSPSELDKTCAHVAGLYTVALGMPAIKELGSFSEKRNSEVENMKEENICIVNMEDTIMIEDFNEAGPSNISSKGSSAEFFELFKEKNVEKEKVVEEVLLILCWITFSTNVASKINQDECRSALEAYNNLTKVQSLDSLTLKIIFSSLLKRWEF